MPGGGEGEKHQRGNKTGQKDHHLLNRDQTGQRVQAQPPFVRRWHTHTSRPSPGASAWRRIPTKPHTRHSPTASHRAGSRLDRPPCSNTLSIPSLAVPVCLPASLPAGSLLRCPPQDGSSPFLQPEPAVWEIHRFTAPPACIPKHPSGSCLFSALHGGTLLCCPALASADLSFP